MANFRHFILYNIDKSESIDLNDFNGYLVKAPSGIGIYLKNSYFNVGSKRILTDQVSEYSDISLTLDIYASKRSELEGKYFDFETFVSKYMKDGFKLAYIPDNMSPRYIDCDIKMVDKKEKSTSNIMSLMLTVQPRTLWRVDEISESAAQDEQGGNKWSFDEDTDIIGITRYDVLTSEIYGKQELSIVGYNKSTLPDGLNLSVGGIRITMSDFVESNEVFVATKIEDGKMAIVTIDIGNSSITTEVKDVVESLVDATYGGTIKKVYSSTNPGYIYNIDFSAEDVPYDKTSTFGAIAAGQKSYSYYLKTPSTTPPEIYIKNKVYLGGDNINYAVEGYIYKGKSNYVESFIQDADTGEYNIAMYSGATVFNSIVNDGYMTVPLRVCVYGVASNPVIKIFPKGSTGPVQTSKINYVIPNGAYFEIDADPETSGARIHLANGTVINGISLLDQTTNMFIVLPRGAFDIQITDDNNNPVVTKIFYKKEYYGAS